MAENRNKGLARDFKVDRAKIDPEKRTVELAFSSEEPVERWGENEVLSHDKGDYDFDRLNDSHPLLLGHNEYDPKSQIGVIESARVDKDKIARAVVRFGNSALATEIFNDVKDGIRSLVSVGYDRTSIVSSKKAADNMVTTRYRWTPTHIAIVPVPADTKVGVGREKVDSPQPANVEDIAKNLTPEQKTRMKILLDAAANPPTGAPPIAVDESKIRSTAVEDFRKADGERRKKIRAAGDILIKDRPDMRDRLVSLVNESCEGEADEQTFNIRAMREMITTKPANQITMRSLGCNQKEIDRYSLVRAVQSCVIQKSRGAVPDGLEGELHQEMSKRDLGFTPMGFLVPADANISPRTLGRADVNRMTRDMQVNIFGQGGATVATELMTPIIEILRNRMVMMSLGVRSLAGLEGNVVIPRQTGAGTAYAVSEIAQLTLSNQILDQVPISPKRVGTTGNYSKQLVLQSSIDVESFMRDDFIKVLAIMWDRIILNGAGAGDEALGILQTPGIGSVNFGAAATFAKLVSFWTSVATANADVGEMGYVTSVTAAGVLQAAAKLLVGATTVAANPLWEGNGSNGRVNGYRAEATNQMPSNLLLFGVFSEAIHALWGGYDVVVDPFTLADKGEVKITMNTYGDVAVRHPQCFCASSDSAAQ